MAFINVFKHYWHFAQDDRWKIITYIIIHLLSTGTSVFVPYVFAQILNSFQEVPADEIFDVITYWTLIWGALIISGDLLHRLGRWFEFDVGYKVKQRFINHYYKRLTDLPMSWHNDHASGDTINRINISANALYDFGKTQFIYVQQFTNFWGPLIALAFLSIEIAVFSLFVAILAIFVIRRFDKIMVRLYRKINGIEHKISATFFDYVSNIKSIITLRLGNRTAKELDHTIAAGYKHVMHTETNVNQWKWFFVMMFVTGLKINVVFYYVWKQLNQNGPVLVGNIAAVFQYLEKLTSTFGAVAYHYQQILQWHTDIESVEEIDAAFHACIPPRSKRIRKWKNVEIQNIHLKYNDEQTTLHNVDFNFKRGEKIALVGESGSGKSSLMSVIRGLYAVEDNVKVKIDGKEYSNLAPLYRLTTLIPQEPEVFDNTVKFNMTVGLRYKKDKIDRAVELAVFDKVLKTMEKGYNTRLTEKGASLSGGQRQRLALARGVLAAEKSSIILMDEPTSSMDAANELKIYKNLLRHFEVQTVISSIHRLHLLSLFDRIVVMDQGRIKQIGTFSSLRKEEGLFKSLWDKYEQSSQS